MMLNTATTKWYNFGLVKLKASANDQINVNIKLKFVQGREENIFGNGEDVSY